MRTEKKLLLFTETRQFYSLWQYTVIILDCIQYSSNFQIVKKTIGSNRKRLIFKLSFQP